MYSMWCGTRFAAVHRRVGVLDLTGFAKYDISDPEPKAS